jgi:dTDP-4-amino-4,6-dideoxygalactose transaminase
VTTNVSDRLLRLPFFNGLTDEQIERVVDSFVRATTATVG